jgi:MFS family permease
VRTSGENQQASVERAALTSAVLASFLTPFTGSAITVAVPAIARDLTLDTVTVGWVLTSYLLAAAAGLVPVGRLADLYGRKRTFAAGLAAFALASGGCAAASSGATLIAARIAQGLASAMIFGTGIAIVTSVVPAGRRGRALGLTTATVYVGLSVGPVVGGAMTAYLGWRSIYVAVALLAAASAAIVRARLPGEWRGAAGERFDIPGALLYSSAITASLVGLTRLPAPLGWGLLGAGLLGWALFAAWERRLVHPLIDVVLLGRNRVFALSNIAALINYSATAAVSFFLSLYLQQVRGLPPGRAGLLLASQPILQALVSPWAGHLSDRAEPRLVSSAGMALIVVGLSLFAVMPSEAPLPLVAACLGVLGIGFGLFSSPNTNAVMGSVEPKHYGVASATLSTMRLSGQTLSMAIAVLLVTVYAGRVELSKLEPAAFLVAFRSAFAVFAVLCAFGVAASAARGKREGSTPAADKR